MKREVVVFDDIPERTRKKLQDRLNLGWRPVLASIMAVPETLSKLPGFAGVVFFEKDDE